MQFFDKHPQLFRIFYSLIAAVLLSIAGISLWQHATSATDENDFHDAPSQFYFTENIPVESVDFNGPPADDSLSGGQPDSIMVGDLLISINGREFISRRRIDNFLFKRSGQNSFQITVFRPTERRGYTFLAQKPDFPDSVIRDIPFAVAISNVLQDGASDRAGLKIGDLILRINGQSFKDAREADIIMQGARVGKAIDYQILRANENLTVRVTLAEVGIQLWVLALILCGLIFVGSGIFIALKRPRYKAARLIGYTFLAVGFMLLCATRRNVDADLISLVRDFLLMSSLFFSFAFWLDMSHYFPVQWPELIRRKWVRVGAYLLASSIVIILTLQFITRQRGSFLGWGILIMAGYVLGCIFWFRKSQSGQYQSVSRTLNHTILWVILINIFVALAEVIFVYDNTSGKLTPSNLMAILGLLPITLIPFSYLYTIGRYNLLDLDIRVRRNIQYVIVSAMWKVLLGSVLFLILYQLITTPFQMPNIEFQGTFLEINPNSPMSELKQQSLQKAAVLTAGLVIVLLGLYAHRWMQKYIDQIFYRSQYDYRQASGELAEVLASELNINSLARGIIQKLQSLLKIKQAGVIFLKEERLSACREVTGVDQGTWEKLCNRVIDPTVNLIQQNRSDSRFSTEYLPDHLRPPYEAAGFQHLIAIRSKDKLVGILLIGEKLSESPFHKEDLSFLSGIAKQAAVAIENAFLYDELAEQERLKYELEIARRIQLASLPQITPEISGLDIAGISIPAQEVGGDYFDYLNGNPGNITVIVGDVSGKGTSAALYMSKVQGIMRSLHDFGLSPRDLFIRANQLLFEGMERQSFITASGAAFNAANRQMKFARAGHMPLFYYHSDSGAVEQVTPKGIGLGLTNSHRFDDELEEWALDYQSGDIFVFITDGITEAFGSGGDIFGEEGLLEIIQNANNASAKRIRDQIITAVNQFSDGRHQHDDLTVVVVKAT